jgi:hypothetical protein
MASFTKPRYSNLIAKQSTGDLAWSWGRSGRVKNAEDKIELVDIASVCAE